MAKNEAQDEVLPPRWMKPRKAVAYSGVGRSTIFAMLKDGRLTTYKPTKGLTLIDREELDALIANSANAYSK